MVSIGKRERLSLLTPTCSTDRLSVGLYIYKSLNAVHVGPAVGLRGRGWGQRYWQLRRREGSLAACSWSS